MPRHFHEAALALVLVMTVACSSSHSDSEPSAGGSGAAAATGTTAGRGGKSSGGASAGSGGSKGGATSSNGLPGTYGRLETRWSIIDGATGETVPRCEDVEVEYFRLALRNNAENSRGNFDATCFEGMQTYEALVGTWDVRALLMTHGDVPLAGLSADGPELTEVRAGETIVFEPFIFEMYAHRLPWTVSKAGMPSTCEAVGASQVKIKWINESSLSVVQPCSAGMTGLIRFQGVRTLLNAELLDSTGRVISTWELRFWELAGTGAQPPPTINFDVP